MGEHILSCGSGEEKLLRSCQVKGVFRNWEKYGSKNNHYNLSNTTQVSQKIKHIVNLSVLFELLVVQVDAWPK